MRGRFGAAGVGAGVVEELINPRLNFRDPGGRGGLLATGFPPVQTSTRDMAGLATAEAEVEFSTTSLFGVRELVGRSLLEHQEVHRIGVGGWRTGTCSEGWGGGSSTGASDAFNCLACFQGHHLHLLEGSELDVAHHHRELEVLL